MTEADKLKEKPAQEKAVAKPRKKKAKKKVIHSGRVYVLASYNNTLVTVTDSKGDPVVSISAGKCGFSGTKKSTPYAAQVAAERAIEKAKLIGLEKADVFVRGIGAGRDQAIRAIASSGISMESITDTTSVPHGGCRPRKSRRV